MNVFLKVFIFLSLQFFFCHLLFAQSDCQKEIRDLQSQKAKLIREKYFFKRIKGRKVL